jgi:Flp pilus assembly CpaE family ATPase
MIEYISNKQPPSLNDSPESPEKEKESNITEIGTKIVSNIDLPPLTERGIIVASTSSKGGSGKTTVALCTASTLYHSSRLAAEKGLRERPFNVVVVDLDIRDGQVGFLLGKDKPTFLNLWMENRDNPEIELLKSTKEGGVLHYDEGLGIWSLLAPISSLAADLIRPEFFQKLIYNLSLKFDVVVVNTSSNYLDRISTKAVFPMVDLLMFVTNMSKGSLFGMTRWIKTLVDDVEDSKIAKDKIGIIVNQIIYKTGVKTEDIMKHGLGINLIATIPSDAVAFVKATNENKLENIVLKHPTIANEYFTIVKKIVEQMGQPSTSVISTVDSVFSPLKRFAIGLFKREPREEANNPKPSDEDWFEGMLNGWGADLTVREKEERVRIVAFLQQNMHLIQQMPDDPESAGKAWASRRSWDNCANVLSQIYEPHARRIAMRGFVGEAAEATFDIWFKNLKLPTYQEVISNPEDLKWNDYSDDELFIILNDVVSYLNETNIKESCRVFEVGNSKSSGDKINIFSSVSRTLVDRIRNLVPEAEKRGEYLLGLLQSYGSDLKRAGLA